MLIFFLKQLMGVRQAILGRNEPAQLAWGVAFGVLLGIVPHGNLLAIVLLVVLLSLRLNHGIATLAAVCVTFMATRLDPYSHQVGRYVLTHEDLSRHVANAWQMPFVPWTDLNNTIVMGSVLIGFAALIPIFLLTYPVFHWFASKGNPIDGNGGAAMALDNQSQNTDNSGVPDGYSNRPRVRIASDTNPASTNSLQLSAIDAAMTGMNESAGQSRTTSTDAEPQLIETRIDVIRIGVKQDSQTPHGVEATDVSKQDEPMSEALRYLLRQVREANRRSAA